MKILVTGAAGFIGSHLVRRLCRRGDTVVGLDNLNDYYAPSLKYARLGLCGIAEADTVQGRMARSSTLPGYTFVRLDITSHDDLERLWERERPDAAVNLAAQAGVRYSLENPRAYVETNVCGFLNVLECCRRWPVRHLVYASSSSVYGGNAKTPFAEGDRVDRPVSVYAATKKADELLAGVYSHLYGVPATGLRFFTVYGPWGRPDMAPMLFADAITRGREIQVFNHGRMERDFTYIDDIVEGMVRVIDRKTPTPVYNIGHGRPMQLMDFIAALERGLGRPARMRMMPMQPGDVPVTWADTSLLERDHGYHPATTLEEGIEATVEWYKDYNRLT